MPNILSDADPEGPGSRFTSRPAFALAVSEDSPYFDQEGAGHQAATAQVGEWLFEDLPEIGAPRVENTSIGRGASVWAPVYEWVVDWIATPAAQGVVGAAATGAVAKAWSTRRRAARLIAELIARVRGTPRAKILVSRGMAGVLAVHAVADRYSVDDALVVLLIEESSALGEHGGVYDVSYESDEPWLVLMRDASYDARYLVAVSASGEVLDMMRVPYSDAEKFFLGA
jgi:hypothetical protein